MVTSWTQLWGVTFFGIFHAVAQRDSENKRVGNTARMTADVTVLQLMQKILTFFSIFLGRPSNWRGLPPLCGQE
jgi:hypothetical protein